MLHVKRHQQTFQRKGLKGFIATTILAIALYTLLFSTYPGYELVAQLSAIALCGLAGLIVASTRGASKETVSTFEVSLLLISTASLLAALINNSVSMASNSYSSSDTKEYAAIYAVLMLVCSFVLMVVSRSFSADELFSAAGWAFIGMITTAVLFQSEGLLQALSFNSASRWETRFSPFEMHPNLVGFVYGGGFIILLYKALTARGVLRGVFAAGAAACPAFILAASSRGALLALLLASGIIAIVNINKIPLRAKVVGVGLFAIFSLGLIAKFDLVSSYLTDVLELESDTRGLDSGGSGRTEIWRFGIDLIFSRSWELYVGSGLRSIDFATENSYIQIVIESGLVFGGVFIATIFAYCYQAASRARWSVGRDWYQYNCFLYIILYVLIESSFNRYLLAIGNVMSLSFLLFCGKLGVLRRIPNGYTKSLKG